MLIIFLQNVCMVYRGKREGDIEGIDIFLALQDIRGQASTIHHVRLTTHIC